jgi:hypothetical protein
MHSRSTTIPNVPAIFFLIFLLPKEVKTGMNWKEKNQCRYSQQEQCVHTSKWNTIDSNGKRAVIVSKSYTLNIDSNYSFISHFTLEISHCNACVCLGQLAFICWSWCLTTSPKLGTCSGIGKLVLKVITCSYNKWVYVHQSWLVY